MAKSRASCHRNAVNFYSVKELLVSLPFIRFISHDSNSFMNCMFLYVMTKKNAHGSFPHSHAHKSINLATIPTTQWRQRSPPHPPPRIGRPSASCVASLLCPCVWGCCAEEEALHKMRRDAQGFFLLALLCAKNAMSPNAIVALYAVILN